MSSESFQRPISRRGFLTVGTIGLGGLTLGRLSPAPGPGRPEELRADRRQGRLGHPHLPAGRHRPPGDVRPQAVRADRVPRRAWARSPTKIDGERFSETLAADRPGRRQADRDPLDDARRGGPRARHAQHVHRLPAEPGPPVSRAWGAWSRTSTARGTTCRPTSACPTSPTSTPAPATSARRSRPFSLGRDPADARLPGPGPEPARRDRRARGSPPAATSSTPSTTTSPARRRATTSRRWTPSTSGPTA